MHACDSLEVGYCYTGSGVLFIEDRVVPFTVGDICVVGEGLLRMSRSANGRPSRWSYFWLDPALLLTGTPEALESIDLRAFSSPSFPAILSHRRHREVCLTVERIMAEMRERREGYRLVVKGLACAMMGLLLRVIRDLPHAEAATDRKGLGRIAPALHHMAGAYAEPIDVRDLAGMCHMSKTHFRRLFQAAIGKPPLKYLSELRSRMAAALLAETDKPVSLIAYEVGFESINTFNRQFQATLKLTPTQWRHRSGRTASAAGD